MRAKTTLGLLLTAAFASAGTTYTIANLNTRSTHAAAHRPGSGPVADSIAAVLNGGGVTQNGSNYVYNYSMSLSSSETLSTTVTDSCNTGPCNGTFFTIYDFAGYVAGSASAPANWTATASLNAPTPIFLGGLPSGGWDITFTYNGPLVSGPVTSSGFDIDSIFASVTTNGDFAYQSGRVGSTSTDVGLGPVDVPFVPSPEPASMALIGGGLIGLAALRRKLAREPGRRRRQTKDSTH